MSDKEVFKTLEGLIESLDKRIENKVYALIVKVLNTKFAILSLHLAFASILLVAIFYMNDRTIKSSLKESMIKQTEAIKVVEAGITVNNKAIKKLSKDMKALIRMHNEKPNREPDSVKMTSL